MKTLNWVAALATLAITATMFATTASAQATRTWVSGVGDDANPCSRTAPCKTFAGAISKTAAAGEINCLDPGGFGALTITKSISIICTGVEGGVLVSGTNGMTVSAATTDTVYLSGLDFEGINSGLNGVQVNTAAQVTVADSIIRGFTTAGIKVSNSTSGVHVFLLDDVIADNTGTGVLIIPASGQSVRATITGVSVSHSGSDGIMLNASTTTGSIKAAISSSTSATNGGSGFVAFSAGADDEMNIDTSTASDNVKGVAVNGTGTIARITRMTVMENTTGLFQTSNGTLGTYQTNSVNGNGADVSGTLTTVGQQ